MIRCGLVGVTEVIRLRLAAEPKKHWPSLELVKVGVDMGVFDFVKEAGAKVGIGDSKEDKAAAAALEEAKEAAEKAAEASKQAASDQQAKDMAEQVKARKRRRAAKEAKEEREERLEESKKSLSLERYIKAMGIDIDKLDVRFNDGVATITGTAASQEIREKAILALGNTSSVSQVHDRIKVPDDAAEESDMHVVVSGDTLSKIAKEVYGDAMKYPVIFEANKPMLSDPDKIYVGQVLRIPVL